MKIPNPAKVLEKFLSRNMFRKIRRSFPLCQYNYHSGTMVKGMQKNLGTHFFEGMCKHCGKSVQLDYEGHWRHIIAVWTPEKPTEDQGPMAEQATQHNTTQHK